MYRIPSYIPVVFHNLAGYDAHLFIKELAKHTSKIGVIAKNTENYISFSVKVEVEKYTDKLGNEKSKEIELRFIDSFKFMSSSLDSLINNLAKGGHEFWRFEKYNLEQRKLLIRKGVYPYEYMDSWDKFGYTLPDIDKFYSKLNMSGISEEDHQHAKKVWNEFKLKNMGDYHDLHLETDVKQILYYICFQVQVMIVSHIFQFKLIPNFLSVLMVFLTYSRHIQFAIELIYIRQSVTELIPTIHIFVRIYSFSN